MNSIDWSMWEAIGTVGATSIAVLTIIGKWVKDWFQRPKFVYSVQPIEGYPTPDSKAFYLDIHNKSKTTALKVKVKISHIQFENSSTNLDLDIGEEKSLRWGDNERYLIVKTHSLYSNMWVFGGDEITGEIINRQNCEIELLITGDNFRGFKKKIKLSESDTLNEPEMTIIE